MTKEKSIAHVNTAEHINNTEDYNTHDDHENISNTYGAKLKTSNTDDTNDTLFEKIPNYDQTTTSCEINTELYEIYEGMSLNYTNSVSYMSCSSLKPDGSRISPKDLLNFKNSIKENGFLEPLIINDTGDIIDGNKRYYAAVQMNMPYVPTVSSDSEYTPSYIDLMNSLTDPLIHFFEKAKIVNLLTEKYLFTQEKVAIFINCSQSYVANKLRLLKFSEYQMALISESGLSERHARSLLRIKNNELRTIAICHIRDTGLNVAAAEEYIDELTEGFETNKEEPADPHSTISKTCKEINKLADNARKCGILVKINRTEDDHAINYMIKIFKR